jgi:hypothetical protein
LFTNRLRFSSSPVWPLFNYRTPVPVVGKTVERSSGVSTGGRLASSSPPSPLSFFSPVWRLAIPYRKRYGTLVSHECVVFPWMPLCSYISMQVCTYATGTHVYTHCRNSRVDAWKHVSYKIVYRSCKRALEKSLTLLAVYSTVPTDRKKK